MTHDERVFYHLYTESKSPLENAERIVDLEELVEELLPYAGSSCPEECRYREECDGEENRGSGGWPLVCVAYGHLLDAARTLGVEVDGERHREEPAELH